MNEEKSWKAIGDAWREDTPLAEMSDQEVLLQAQRTARGLRLLAIAVVCVAVAAMASLSTLAIVHRSVFTYSFAIIGWSIFLPIGTYLAVHRKEVAFDTLDSGSMLDALLRKQRAKRNILEFLITLLGVETVIACAFWIAGRSSTHQPLWSGGSAIFLIGMLVTGVIWWQRKRVDAKIEVLTGLRNTLREDSGDLNLQ